MNRILLLGFMFGLLAAQQTYAEIDYDSDAFNAALHCAAVTVSIDSVRFKISQTDSRYTPVSAFYLTGMVQSGPEALEMMQELTSQLFQLENDGNMSEESADALLDDYEECAGQFLKVTERTPEILSEMERVADELNSTTPTQSESQITQDDKKEAIIFCYSVTSIVDMFFTPDGPYPSPAGMYFINTLRQLGLETEETDEIILRNRNFSENYKAASKIERKKMESDFRSSNKRCADRYLAVIEEHPEFVASLEKDLEEFRAMQRDGSMEFVRSLGLIDSPGPHHELASKLPFLLHGLERTSTTDNEKEYPGLGVTVGYKGQDVKVTIYIYDKGLGQIPDGPDNALAAEELGNAIDDIKFAVETGHYEKMEIIGDKYFSGSPDRGFEFRCVDLEMASSNIINPSLLCVSGHRGHFIKIRLTKLETGTVVLRDVVDNLRCFFGPMGGRSSGRW